METINIELLELIANAIIEEYVEENLTVGRVQDINFEQKESI